MNIPISSHSYLSFLLISILSFCCSDNKIKSSVIFISEKSTLYIIHVQYIERHASTNLDFSFSLFHFLLFLKSNNVSYHVYHWTGVTCCTSSFVRCSDACVTPVRLSALNSPPVNSTSATPHSSDAAGNFFLSVK